MPAAKKSLILAVDIGGTKVAAGLVDARGNVLIGARAPMAAKSSAQDGLAAVFNAIDKILRHRRARQARAIGVSVPGWVDSRRGLLLGAANLPCWKNYPLALHIRRRYGLPVRLGNDGNTAALAEAAWGAAAGYRNVFYVSLGTGIGTGIVLNRRLYDGRTGAASEGGHVSIDYRGDLCACGKRGCIEVYASGPAIARRARERLASAAPGSAILKLASGKLDSVTTELVSKAAQAGDPLAREILRDSARYLGMWLGNMIDLLDPDVLVVGGGVANMLKPFYAKIKEGLPGWCVNPNVTAIPLVIAHYGADAGIAGGAALCAIDNS